MKVFESAKLIYDDKTQEIILKFIRDYAGAQHSLEWANFIGSAAFDIVLKALLAFATGDVGAVVSVGSGSAADAIRHERLTGEKVGGALHTQKGNDSIRELEKWLEKNPTATPGDRAAAENMILDLKNALGQ